MLEFVLFVLLGLAIFVPVSGNGRIVLLVVYVVLLLLWLLQGTGTTTLPHIGGKW